MNPNPKIIRARALAQDRAALTRIRRDAKRHHPPFPTNGCACFLSVLLRAAGLDDLAVILGAEELADTLEARGWFRVPVGQQQAGDVGVCQDLNGNGRSDHIFFVVQAHGADRMTIVDNQATGTHTRYASGRGKTPVRHFLRAKP
jgi:hypothetical protein